jgi:hypothetical protein
MPTQGHLAGKKTANATLSETNKACHAECNEASLRRLSIAGMGLAGASPVGFFTAFRMTI